MIRATSRICLCFVISSLFGLRAHAQFTVTSANLHPVSSSYSYATAATETQQAGQIYVGAKYHAALWAGTVASLVDLHPAVADTTWVNAVDGTQQVGYANIGGKSRAAFWSGTAASFADLTPSWAQSSEVLGVFNSQQVGWCNPTNPSSGVHAVLWSGNANSCVDLHPPFWKSSRAYATSGSNQVGYVEQYNSGNIYAALWSGTAGSFVELGPEFWGGTSVTWSEAIAVGGTNKVGFYQLYNEFITKAALWSGSPGSFVSLHPVGATSSYAWATTDTLQAGTATVNGQLCLALWRGTPESFRNLGPIASGLGTGLTNLEARGFRIKGNAIFLAGDVNSKAVYVKIQLLPPDLHLAGIQPQAGSYVASLTWTDNGVPALLETSDAVNSGWGLAAGRRTTNGNSYSAIVTNTASAQFFRLRAN